MPRVKRVVYGLPIIVAALLPLSASAAPSLSPTLDHVLQAPPAGYSELSTTGLKNGHFTAHEFAQTYGVKNAEAERLMTEYGFVDGYNMTWGNQATHRVLNEFVLAFKGGAAATKWLAYDKGADTGRPEYRHADTLTGIPQYFGVNEMQSSVSGQAYLDGFVFVKGNDVFGVAYVSLADDNLNPATAQAKSQYASAPDATIPPAQWPENNAPPSPTPSASNSSSPALGTIGILIAVAALVIGGAAVGLLLFMRSRSMQAVPEVVSAAPFQPMAPPPTAVQMSPDGRYWFDGQRWRDSAYEAPPYAQRSPDGAFWWDGANWRPMPQAVPQSSGR
jgi:hypothetical protein